MRDLIACEKCRWFSELTEEEIKENKKRGINSWDFWCHFEFGFPIETSPDNFCSKFYCICGGDAMDGENHLNCLDVLVELE